MMAPMVPMAAPLPPSATPHRPRSIYDRPVADDHGSVTCPDTSAPPGPLNVICSRTMPANQSWSGHVPPWDDPEQVARVVLEASAEEAEPVGGAAADSRSAERSEAPA